MPQSFKPRIMVAPTGARRTKADHPALPVTIDEIVQETAACAAAGADALHLHVRGETGEHSLDPGLYREALSALSAALPGFPVQITTEAAGIYGVEAQFQALKALRPAAASISVREIARDEALAPRVYRLCQDNGTQVQHILYDIEDLHQLTRWHKTGIIAPHTPDVIFVFGRYAPALDAKAPQVKAAATALKSANTTWSACAFGPGEQSVLCAAAAHGARLRIGFENNIHAPGGGLAQSNAANVAALTLALASQTADPS